MRKLLLSLTTVALILVVIITKLTTVISAEVQLTDRVINTWSETNSGSNSVTVFSVSYNDPTYNSGRLLTYISWVAPSASDVNISSVAADMFTYFDSSSITTMVDDDNDTETPDIEYVLHSALYVLEDGFDGNVNVQWDGTFSAATVNVVALAGVSAIENLGEQSSNSTLLEYHETSADDTTLPMGFVTTVYPPSQISTVGGDTYEVSTATTGWNSSSIETSVFALNNTTLSGPATVEFLDSFDSPESTEYQALGIDITFIEAETSFEVVITSGPDVVGDTVQVTGQAVTTNPSFWVSEIYYYLNFDGLTYMDAADGTYDEDTEEFDLYLTGLTPGNYTLEFYASETDGIDTYNTEGDGPVIVNFEIVGDAPVDPEISITTGPTTTDSSYINSTGTVTDANDDIITRIYYTIDGGAEVDIDPVDGVFDESTEEFEITNLGPYQNGVQVDFVIGVENDLAETATVTYNNVTINNTSPLAACVLSNVTSPTSDQTPTSTITCTSDDTITDMEYRYYNFVEGEVIGFTHIGSLSAGNYGENSVSASITPGVNLPEGNNELKVRAYTGTGRFHDQTVEIPVDVFIVEAVDNSDPTIKLNPILPDPITATSPIITGSCQDVNEFDTNSVIASLQYQVDGGSWVNITPLNAPLDNAIEDFSFPIPAQSLGEHTVTIRCADSVGNTTHDSGGNKSTTFEIITQPDVEPEEVEITETFEDDDLNSVNETTAVWGNGYLRLREKIMWDRTNVDTTNFLSRYEPSVQNSFLTKKYGGEIWYAKKRTVHRYVIATGTTTDYNSLVGAGNVITDFEYFSSGGNEYLLTSNDQDGLTLHNLTANTHTVYDLPGFDSSDYGMGNIVRDSRSGRLGFFVTATDPNIGADSNLYYINLNNTPANLGDDTVTWYPTTAGFDMTNFSRLVIDETRNMIFGFSYDDNRLYKIFDNNTPANTADDQRFEYNITAVDGIAVDPTNGNAYVIRQLVISDLYVITDNGTPTNIADDTVLQLTDANGLRQQQAVDIEFVDGPDYVGAQLFITTTRGDLLYYNTNDSPLNKADDTILDLKVNEGLYPEFIGGFEMGDYNTVYANFQRSGFARIDLNRSWDTTNQAVTITLPPEVRLIVDNVNLEQVNVGPLLEDIDGAQEENTDAVGIQYFISLDDGVTYNEIDVGDLQNNLDEDYRLKLKIVLTKIGENSKTPIIEGFTVAYAAYQEVVQPDQGTLEVTPSATSFTTSQQFTLSFRVEDSLGYVIPSYNGTLDLELQNFADNSPATGFNHTTVNVVNGVATINNAQISQTGEYRIVASNADYTANTVQLTVTNPPVDEENDPQPTMTFYANRYSILPGEEATLTWATEHLTNVKLTPGSSVSADGSLTVSPEQTTHYVLSGTTSSNNTMSTGLTITVLGVGNEGCVEEDPADCEQTEVPPTEPTAQIGLTVTPQTVTVQKGGKVQISWVASNADDVFIDYTNSTSSPTGSFEFFPTQDVVVTITARRGLESVSRQVQVFVVEEEFVVGPSALGISTPAIPGIAAIASLFAVAVLNGGLANYTAIFFGLLIWRKRKYWGVVFDSSTYKPLALVTVRIYRKTQTARVFVAQTVTDLEGRYGINISDAGSYTVEFVREGYSSLLREITITRNEDVILDVGMREVNEIEGGFGGIRYFWKQNAAGIMQVLRVAVVILMTWGLSLALQAIAQDASFANYLVAGLYLIVLLLQIVIILEPYFGRKSGAVVDSESRRPVHGAVVRLLNVEDNGQSVEDVGISNQSGIIKIRVKKGAYQYMASRSGYETSEGSATIDAGGKLTKLIGLKRAAPGQATKFGT